jgi:hypothetical protein
MLATRNRLFSALPLLGLLVLAGCGGKKGATITGTLVLPSNVELADNDAIKVSFVPAEQGTDLRPAVAQVSPTEKTFVIYGPDRHGVAPGKYLVAVKFQVYPGTLDTEASKREKAFEGLNKRYDDTHTKLTCDVTAEPQQTITIDLGAGTVR